MDERRAAARRRAVGRRGAAPRRLPHGAHRQAALRAVPRPVRPLRRERARASGGRPRSRGRRHAGPHRGFEHFESATHTGAGPLHYARWLADAPPRGGRDVLPGARPRRSRSTRSGGGDTGAPQVHDNPIPREWYHTDWVADRTIAWLDSLAADDDWFCWMSFPDPHHPWDPPAVGARPRRLARRAAARRLPRRRRRARARSSTPSRATGGAWYDGPLVSNYEAPLRLGAGDADRRPGPRGQRPQRRRVRADRRGARPGARGDRRAGLGRRRRRRLHDRPRRAAGRLRPAVQGAVPRRRADAAAADLAAGAVGRRRRRRSVDAPGRARRPRADVLRDRRPRPRRRGWRAGRCPSTTPTPTARGFERVLTEWDSELFGVDVHLRTITRDGWVCTDLPARAPCTTAPRASCTTSTDDPLQQRQPLGRPGAAPRCAATSSPTCGTTNRRRSRRGAGSKRRSDTPFADHHPGSRHHPGVFGTVRNGHRIMAATPFH